MTNKNLQTTVERESVTRTCGNCNYAIEHDLEPILLNQGYLHGQRRHTLIMKDKFIEECWMYEEKTGGSK